MQSLSRQNLQAATLICGLTIIAYLPAMTGGFIWDDDDYVTANANLASLDGLQRIWLEPRSSPQYYPLVFSSFWIEHQLWGNSPAGYHIVNVLLHAAAAVLLWRVLVRLDVRAALVAACLFALHPVHVESVAWITERKNVLSAVFYFAAALTFLQSEARRFWWTIPLFAAALLSKTVTCSLPAALLLIWWWKRRALTRRERISLAVMFALGAVFAFTTAWLERDHVLAVGREWDYSWIDRILIAGRAVWFYASKLVLPVDLSFIYPLWPIDPGLAWQWAFPLAALVALAVLWAMRQHWGRGPLVAALIFCGTLVPALGFFNIYPMRYSLVADHFQYHASAALLALIAVGLDRLGGRKAFFVLAPLLVLTMIRAHVLADAERLWRDTADKNPDSWMVQLNLAKVLSQRGNDTEAQRHFERQTALAPNLPETHWNLAVNLLRRGRLDEAIARCDRAIAIDPGFPQAYYTRGRVFAEKHDPDRAAADLERAIELKPDYAAAHNELGELLVKQKRVDLALSHYQAAIAADPGMARARVNLAATLARLGRSQEATAQFEQAVRIDPALEQYRAQVLGP